MLISDAVACFSRSIAVQVKLFDECEKLLTCRLLKNDESVTSGETMEFNGYLVDIGDPEGGNYKTGSDLNVDIKHKNASRFKTPCGMNFMYIYLFILLLVILTFQVLNHDLLLMSIWLMR